MKMNVNFSMFVSAFESAGRTTQFSYEGKRTLFEYLCDMEDSMGEEIELDIIGLCCDYTEYDGVELLDGFSHFLNGDEKGDEEKIEAIIGKLVAETEVIGVKEGEWIVRNF